MNDPDAAEDRGWGDELAALERDGALSTPWVDAAIAWLADQSAPRAIEHDHFGYIRDLIGDRLGPVDADALDTLLDADQEGSLARRADLLLLSAQTVHVG